MDETKGIRTSGEQGAGQQVIRITGKWTDDRTRGQAVARSFDSAVFRTAALRMAPLE